MQQRHGLAPLSGDYGRWVEDEGIPCSLDPLPCLPPAPPCCARISAPKPPGVATPSPFFDMVAEVRAEVELALFARHTAWLEISSTRKRHEPGTRNVSAAWHADCAPVLGRRPEHSAGQLTSAGQRRLCNAQSHRNSIPVWALSCGFGHAHGTIESQWGADEQRQPLVVRPKHGGKGGIPRRVEYSHHKRGGIRSKSTMGKKKEAANVVLEREHRSTELDAQSILVTQYLVHPAEKTVAEPTAMHLYNAKTGEVSMSVFLYGRETTWDLGKTDRGLRSDSLELVSALDKLDRKVDRSQAETLKLP